MEEAKGSVKHVVVVKFQEEVSESEIDQLIKGFANLINLVDSMDSFHWGKDVSTENLHQGYTHIFESGFKSTEAVAEYAAHPAHVEFATLLLGRLEKFIIFDYNPTTVDGSRSLVQHRHF